MEYWYKTLGTDEKAKMIFLKKGDLITTPPLEIHTLTFGNEGNSFIVFSSGPKGVVKIMSLTLSELIQLYNEKK